MTTALAFGDDDAQIVAAAALGACRAEQHGVIPDQR
jgi:hypothetical protein